MWCPCRRVNEAQWLSGRTPDSRSIERQFESLLLPFRSADIFVISSLSCIGEYLAMDSE